MSLPCAVHSTRDTEGAVPENTPPEKRRALRSEPICASAPVPSQTHSSLFPQCTRASPPTSRPWGSFCLNVLPRVLAGDSSSRATSADLLWTPTSCSAHREGPAVLGPTSACHLRCSTCHPRPWAVYLSSRRLLQQLPLPSEPVSRVGLGLWDAPSLPSHAARRDSGKQCLLAGRSEWSRVAAARPL